MDNNFSSEIYFDNNATTAPLPQVIEAMCAAMTEGFGNPSSPHARGYRCKQHLENARAIIEGALEVDPGTIVFTAGGTESNNLVLGSLFRIHQHNPAGRKPRLITTQVEHSSVLKAAQRLEAAGADVTYLPVDQNGIVGQEDLVAALEKPTDLVSIQWANSETGAIQPIEQLSAISRRQGARFHTDAAQFVGKAASFNVFPTVDFVSFAGHKLHGPQGIGVLYARERSLIQPLCYGGDQEHGLRPGTENLPAILGLAEALRHRIEALDAQITQIRFLRDRFETGLIDRLPSLIINSENARRICNTSNIQFPGVEGQALVAQLSRGGIICSQTSACTSNRPEPSHVLLAMGLSERQAYPSVRFSFSILNTEGEIDHAVNSIAETYQKLLNVPTPLA